MATTSNLRARRNAAQLHALLGVEREIRANDSSGQRKYLRDFSQAFRSYEGVLSAENLERALREALLQLEGAFSVVCIAEDRIIVARDPQGFRPLAMGQLEFSGGKPAYVFAVSLRPDSAAKVNIELST